MADDSPSGAQNPAGTPTFVQTAATTSIKDLDRWQQIGEEEAKLVYEMTLRNELSGGTPIVRQFEQKWRDMVGAKYALTTCNGTAALYSAFYGLGVSPRDEVICPDYTWICTISPVLLHTWGALAELEPLFERYRSAPILLAHAGAAEPESYVAYARKYPNVYLELCFSGAPYGVIEYFVQELGPHRMLFGSDAPYMSIQQQLGRVLFADIAEDDKKTILVDNPKRILDHHQT